MDAADLDFNKAYKVKGFGGVAVRLADWPKVWVPNRYLASDPETGAEYEAESDEGEWEDDQTTGRIFVVMVGDDGKHSVEIEDLVLLKGNEYCHSCGQIGCGCDVRDEEDA